MPDEITDSRRPQHGGDYASSPSQRTYGAGIEGGIAGASLPTPLPRHIAKPINILPLNHGFHVVVGCQEFAVESVDTLLHRLNIYLKDPADAEQKWLSGEWKW